MIQQRIEKLKEIFKKHFIPYFIFFSIFVVFAYIILVLRLFSVETNIMPDITGKYFINVYNDLKKYNLNIEIRKIYIEEKPEGVILQQSILPGETIRPKNRLVLIVNSYEPFLTMPKVINLSLENAKQTLSSVPYEDKVYELPISKILYVYNPNIPENTVLFQFPAPNTKIKLNEKVILILSTSQSTNFEINEIKEMDIGTVSQYFIQSGIPYIITQIVPTKDNRLHGKVKEITYNNKTYELSVYYNKNKKYHFYSDFELENIRYSRKDYCSLHLSKEELDSIEEIKLSTKIWFSEPEIFRDKSFSLVFYRSGNMYLYLLCNDKIVMKKFYEADFSV
jgi:beta-lactam-binding protein with PASTA domain